MGLDVSLVNRLGLELPIHDYVGLLETNFHVAQLVLDMSGHIALLSRVLSASAPLQPEPGGHLLMEQGGVGLEGIIYGEHGGKHFIIDFDQLQGLLSQAGAGGRHGGDGVPLVQGLFAGQHVPGDHADVPRSVAVVDGPLLYHRQVLGGGHRHHAIHSLGLAGVDRPDASVSVGAA